MNLKYHTVWLVIGWCLIALVWYLSLMPKPPEPFKISDKLNHFIAYAGLMGWFCQLYRHHKQRLICGVGFIVMGVVIEFLQGMSRYRMFEYNDMLANTLGVLLAIIVIYLKGDQLLYWFEQRLLKVT